MGSASNQASVHEWRSSTSGNRNPYRRDGCHMTRQRRGTPPKGLHSRRVKSIRLTYTPPKGLQRSRQPLEVTPGRIRQTYRGHPRSGCHGMHGQLPRASTCPVFARRARLATTVSGNSRQKLGDKKREMGMGLYFFDLPVSQLGHLVGSFHKGWNIFNLPVSQLGCSFHNCFCGLPVSQLDLS